jgi:hypothetical protein
MQSRALRRESSSLDWRRFREESSRSRLVHVQSQYEELNTHSKLKKNKEHRVRVKNEVFNVPVCVTLRPGIAVINFFVKLGILSNLDTHLCVSFQYQDPIIKDNKVSARNDKIEERCVPWNNERICTISIYIVSIIY